MRARPSSPWGAAGAQHGPALRRSAFGIKLLLIFTLLLTSSARLLPYILLPGHHGARLAVQTPRVSEVALKVPEVESEGPQTQPSKYGSRSLKVHQNYPHPAETVSPKPAVWEVLWQGHSPSTASVHTTLKQPKALRMVLPIVLSCELHADLLTGVRWHSVSPGGTQHPP